MANHNFVLGGNTIQNAPGVVVSDNVNDYYAPFTDDATATADDILEGYTAYGASGEKLTGTATGGGGDGLSEFDEFCGFTGSAHITLNLVLPQEDPGPFTYMYCYASVYNTSGEEFSRIMEIHFDELHTNEIVLPVSENYVIGINTVGGVTNNGYYYADLNSANLSGDLTWIENDYVIGVNGDGTITAEAISD